MSQFLSSLYIIIIDAILLNAFYDLIEMLVTVSGEPMFRLFWVIAITLMITNTLFLIYHLIEKENEKK